MKLTKLLFIYLALILSIIPLQAKTISELWEESPEYAQYLKEMDNSDIEKAMNIKRETVSKIIIIALKDYIADFKPKYREKYLKEFDRFPLGLVDLTKEIHLVGSALIKDKTEKAKHKFVKSIYDFMNHYFEEDGNVIYFANRIVKRTPDVKGTAFMETLLKMAKESDIEAGKSPEQKKKEYDEFIENENNKQIASQKNIDASQRSIDKWDKIMESLHLMIGK